jgi:hypothetical protein
MSSAANVFFSLDFLSDIYGRKIQILYFRDKEKREVDFVILEKRKPIYFIEVKSTFSQLSPSLLYLKGKFPQLKSIQLVHHDFYQSKMLKDCLMTNLNEWLVHHLLKNEF